MNFDNYILATRETAIYPKEKSFEYLTLGLYSEMGEYAAANSEDEEMAEAGDILWYLTRLIDEIQATSGVENIDPEAIYAARDEYNHIPSKRGLVLTFVQGGSEIAGVVKKVIRDKHGVFSAEQLLSMSISLYRMIAALGVRYALTTLADKNITKLRSRKERGVIGGSGDNR